MLDSPPEVIRCLVTYEDWWQPSTTSLIQVGNARRNKDFSDGFRAGLLETLDERWELCHRMECLSDIDRHILLLWYVKQLPVEDIASALGISRRQAFRRRARAIRTIVELGQPDVVAQQSS